ncbi:MJ1255/VC2487 family glycosyltransferase [Vibrio cidicii]|uniref:MJ1255/VC2487 family glycosyltransferase n=1 Tax=Vibrio cidicii TaxID=1763883 RepID=UPI0037530DBD
MKILYGVQGTGNGHIARARAMANALKQRGVAVDFLFSGREADRYFSMEAFGEFQTCRGLTFATEKGRVSYAKTAMNNSLLQVKREIDSLDLSAYDLVINDFEPVSAWAAKKQHKTCISISHQNAFRYPVPLKGASWLDKQVLQYFAPADIHIGLHWYHFDQPILPPIVNTAPQGSGNRNIILVYLPFEQVEDICELLWRFQGQKFLCYHPDLLDTEVLENVELRALNHQAFQADLHACSGVIANGGFELPSEALSLGKKLLVKPLQGQFEQQSNVATLETLGLASVMDSLDARVVRAWLEEAHAESVTYPDVATAIADWLLQGDWSSQQELSRRLWERVDFPSYVSNL